MATPEWLRYANAGAIRNDPLDPRLVQALGFLGDMGVTMEVFSGGQESNRPGQGVGSTRHNHGGAADVFFLKDGRRLDWANKADLPIFQGIVRKGKEKGITGWGAGPGYMRPGSMHVGFGSPGVWGAGGSGKNAPAWLRMAYEGATDGSAPQIAQASPVAAPQSAAPQRPPAILGAMAPTVAPAANTPAPPAPQTAEKPAASKVASAFDILGSLAPMQAQSAPAPAPVVGRSPQQASALASFIAALKQSRTPIG